MMTRLYTIGYEGATLADFLATLRAAGIKRVVDVRERAQSRRSGFSKTALAAALDGVSIAYEHRKKLGDPKPGRDAARAGRFDDFRRIFVSHMETASAQADLRGLIGIVLAERCVLLCYERDHKHCHRDILCDDLQKLGTIEIKHIGVQPLARSKGKISDGAERYA